MGFDKSQLREKMQRTLMLIFNCVFFFPVLVPGDLKFYRKSSDFVPVVLVEVRCERADVLEVQETRDDLSLSLHQPK